MIIIKLIDKLLNFIVFIFFIVSLAFSIYALYDVYAVYENTELSGEILKYRPSSEEDDSFGNEFSLEDIRKINKDIVGWIRIDDTNIDYPILAGVDNTDYLQKDYNGDYSPSGSIFLDYRNNRSFTDDFSIIYGHNMAKGLMFSDIKKFNDSTFFELHKTGKLYVESGVYDLTIYTFNMVDANKDISYKLQKYNNGHNKEIVDNLIETAINKRELVVNDGDQFLLLSTCYGMGTYDRTVLLTKMTNSNASNVIKSELDEKEDKQLQSTNNRMGIVKKVIVLIIYSIITIIIYIFIFSRKLKKKRSSRKQNRQ